VAEWIGELEEAAASLKTPFKPSDGTAREVLWLVHGVAGNVATSYSRQIANSGALIQNSAAWWNSRNTSWTRHKVFLRDRFQCRIAAITNEELRHGALMNHLPERPTAFCRKWKVRSFRSSGSLRAGISFKK